MFLGLFYERENVMNFTTPIFIFVYFPIIISIYFIVDFLEKRRTFSSVFIKFRVKDLTLIALSMLFYMWACFDDVLNRNFLNLGIIESRNYIRISYGSFLYAGTNGISPFS